MAVSVKSKIQTYVEQESLSFKNAGIINAIGNGGFRQSSIERWRIDATTGGKLKMQTFNADVQDRILALVKAILEQNSIAVEIHPDSRLVDVGLTSMDMVNLMLGVEAEFDFTIPQCEITPENFQSIETLELMISNQLRAEQAA
jgi:acyl carrier protein